MVVANININSWSSRLVHLVIFFGFILSCVFGVMLTVKRTFDFANAPLQYYPPPKQLVHFGFGYERTAADILWIRVLQDLDYCEKKISERDCVSKGWLFKVMDLATDLDPEFVMPHKYGALGLSVLVSDVEGASAIYQKAVERFPNDWAISYWAGYHAMAEEKNLPKAAKYLERSAKSGAPQWVYSLAAKLYTEAGQKEFAMSLIKNLEQGGFDQEILDRMRARIEGKKVPAWYERK